MEALIHLQAFPFLLHLHATYTESEAEIPYMHYVTKTGTHISI